MTGAKLFRNARIYTPMDPGHPLRGDRQGDIKIWDRGALVCRHGYIERIGAEDDVLGSLSPAEIDLEMDCEGKCMIPGLIDPHTHMCFAERREAEFDLRMSGTEYLEILRRGGGILSSVRAVRSATEEALHAVTLKHALSATTLGTTTVEIKSGYGLDTESELRMLRIINRIGRETPLDVVPTFMGAHAIPEECRTDPDHYVDLIVEEMIPAVIDQGVARFCDVFCEQGVFSVAQSRRILQSARRAGLKLKIHADEVHDLGGAGLAAELETTSAEHLLAAREENLRAMARSEVIAVLLPATAFSLRKPYPNARKMVELGLSVALATDCNPGSSYSESMAFAFCLSVVNMHLSTEETLVAATLNAAYAIEMSNHVGSLEVGKQADFLLLDGASPAILAYHAGVSPVTDVFKRGEACSRR